MKKGILSIIITAIIVLCTACGNTASASASAGEMTAEILKDFSSDLMTEVSSERMPSYYNLDLELLEEYSVYIDGSGGFADELAIFKVKNEKDIETVKQSIQSRLEDRKKVFESYSPEEFDKLQNCVIKEQGAYILFSVSDDNSTVEKCFLSFFK